MKSKNWVVVAIIMIVVTVGGIFFGQAQAAKADDVTGTVANVTSANVTVGDKTLVIDSNTKIVGDLVSGASINIKATVQADGTILATLIQVKKNHADKEEAVSDNSTVEKPGNHGNHFGQNKDHGKTGQMHQDNGKHLGNMNRQNQQQD